MNTKYKIHIQANTDEEMRKELQELAFILTGLRCSTKEWHEHFGSHRRAEMAIWERKADEWIERHKVVYQEHLNGHSKNL